MAVFEFHRNARIVVGGAVQRLLKRVDADVWQMEDEATGRLSEQTMDQLLDAFSKGTLSFAEPPGRDAKKAANQADSKPHGTGPWAAANESERVEARRKLCYVKVITGQARSKARIDELVREKATQLRDERPPSASTVRRWYRRYMQGHRDVQALLPQIRQRGNRKPRYCDPLRALIDEALDEIYLQENRPTLQDTYDYLLVRVEQENRGLALDEPLIPDATLAMIKSLLRRRDPFEVCVARYGRPYAVHKFRNVQGHVHVEAGLDRVEIDHTSFDVLVIDETTFLPLGRPTLTVALDIRHRTCLGIYIGFSPPSWIAVMHCLRHAVLPKSYLAQRFPDIKGSWPCHGLMKKLVMDDAEEFWSNVLSDFADKFGIELVYCPVGGPEFKGGVERFVGTINRGIAHKLPGTTFSSVADRGDYLSEKRACVTLQLLLEKVHKWIVEVYHERKHAAIGQPPRLSWCGEFKNRCIPVPSSLQELEEVLAVPDERTLTHKGIQYDHLFYNSMECRALRMRSDGDLRVEVRLPDDVGYLYVLDARAGRFIKVPVLEHFRSYANGLTRWQHDCCVKYSDRHYAARHDPLTLAKSKEDIRRWAMLQLAKRQRTAKKRAARYLDVPFQPFAGDYLKDDHSSAAQSAASPPLDSRDAVNVGASNSTPDASIETSAGIKPAALQADHAPRLARRSFK